MGRTYHELDLSGSEGEGIHESIVYIALMWEEDGGSFLLALEELEETD